MKKHFSWRPTFYNEQKSRAFSIRLTCAAFRKLLWMRPESHQFLPEINVRHVHQEASTAYLLHYSHPMSKKNRQNRLGALLWKN